MCVNSEITFGLCDDDVYLQREQTVNGRLANMLDIKCLCDFAVEMIDPQDFTNTE